MAIVGWSAVFFLSVAVLLFSARFLFVRGAERIGYSLGMSPFLIGATLVAVGTSLPELISSLVAVAKGKTELVAANVVGSNIGNILLILGLTALVSGNLSLQKGAAKIERWFLAVSALFLIVFTVNGVVSFWEGCLLVVVALLYIVLKLRNGNEKEAADSVRKQEKSPHPLSMQKAYLFLLGGVVGLYLGAEYTIESILSLSALLGIPSTIIAITALAVGTSLPELIVSVDTAMQGKYDIAVGNVMGSNIFNAIVIMGIPALITPLAVDALTIRVGLPVLALSTLSLLSQWRSGSISRFYGIIYCLLFGVFLVTLIQVVR